VRATYHRRAPAVRAAGAEYVQADLRLSEDCQRAVAGCDVVFMCAAATSGAAVMTSTPLAHVTPNVVMNAHTLEAAHAAGVGRFVFVSSSAAYPPTADRPVREDEMFSGEPSEVYYSVAWMKRYTEILCRIYAEKIAKPMPALVVRPANVYGPHDKFDFATSHVTAALMRRVIERHRPLEVWGTGDDIRDLIYVDDFVDGVLLALEKAGPFFAVNIASGRGHSIKEVLRTLLEVDGYHDADVRFDPTKPRTVAARPIDTTVAREQLGFTPRIDLREGLRRTVEWYRRERLRG
jgi:GDP-L-fucose synthase